VTKKTIKDVEWAGKRALVRVDFNVPFERGSTIISDDVRIRAALPTVRYLREHGASIVLCTHLGRPAGQPKSDLQLGPVARRLSELVGAPVEYVHDAIGDLAHQQAESLESGAILLLENVRFYPGEEANDPGFASALASLADVYVNDAFGAAHRAHASTEGVAHHIPAVAGLLMDREVTMLGQVLNSPDRPLAAVLGGAKVSDKIGVLERLMTRADAVFIGGGMTATFLKAMGYDVGRSLLEEDCVSFCGDIMRMTGQGVAALHLPTDVVVADRLGHDAVFMALAVDYVPRGWFIADIGPDTEIKFANELGRMKTIVWNGPMGVFEVPPFDEGTWTVANALADSGAVTVIGGGSTAEAVEQMGLADQMSHVSTGGGASLEFLEGRVLPGLAALEEQET
jgi:phosphoglycerate kinase